MVLGGQEDGLLIGGLKKTKVQGFGKGYIAFSVPWFLRDKQSGAIGRRLVVIVAKGGVRAQWINSPGLGLDGILGHSG